MQTVTVSVGAKEISLWVFGETPSGAEAIAAPVEFNMRPMFDIEALEQPPTLNLSYEAARALFNALAHALLFGKHDEVVATPSYRVVTAEFPLNNPALDSPEPFQKMYLIRQVEEKPV